MFRDRRPRKCIRGSRATRKCVARCAIKEAQVVEGVGVVRRRLEGRARQEKLPCLCACTFFETLTSARDRVSTCWVSLELVVIWSGKPAPCRPPRRHRKIEEDACTESAAHDVAVSGIDFWMQ